IDCASPPVRIIRYHCGEHRLRVRWRVVRIDYAFTGNAARIESHQAPVCCHPNFPGARLQQIINVWMRQPLSCAVVREDITIKSGQPISRAEPKKAARVAHDLVDLVMSQTVGNCESLDRQSLGLCE